MNVKRWWSNAAESKALASKAMNLAQEKRLHIAVQEAKKAIALWSVAPNLWERRFCKMAMGNLLSQLQEQMADWQKAIAYAEQLAARAQSYETKSADPLVHTDLAIALNLFERASATTEEKEYHQAIQRCQQELSRRQNYEQLLNQAKQQKAEHFFHEALANYKKLRDLYTTPETDAAILHCTNHLQAEAEYEVVLKRAGQLARWGNFREAITLVRPAIEQLPRSDGKEFLAELHRVVLSKKYFQDGLFAEQINELEQAYKLYGHSLEVLPGFTPCQTRLGVVAIKTNRHHDASKVLEGVNGAQAAYLRGFAYAKQGELQKADYQWSSIASATSQRKILKTLAQWEHLLLLREIERQADGSNLEKARETSLQFLQKFGSDATVEENLEQHIQARLDSSLWQSHDWNSIAKDTQKTWLKEQDIVSLHNWAIAYYYRVKSQFDRSSYRQTLQEFIPVWLTALSNFDNDPALHGLARINHGSVNLNETSYALKQELERLIDDFKEKDISCYLQLRDYYRLGVTASRLITRDSDQLIVLPGCPVAKQLTLRKWAAPNDELGRSLYTDWGLAVAACLEGDTVRALQIKPQKAGNTNAEAFGREFVTYHEGCHYLQNGEWRTAIPMFQEIQAKIRDNSEWSQHIDQLCDVQRQQIRNQVEHLEFAGRWHQILEHSKLAKSYLAEQKAELIRNQLLDNELTEPKAKEELQKLMKLDPENPVVTDIYEKVETVIEMKEIYRLIQAGNSEAVMRRARQSKSKTARANVAEMFIRILAEGAKQKSISPADMRQLGCWAYELCPDEPEFEDVFHSLGLR